MSSIKKRGCFFDLRYRNELKHEIDLCDAIAVKKQNEGDSEMR